MMNGVSKYQNRIELLQGTLDMPILQPLQRQSMHSDAIPQAIRGRSCDVLSVETGSLHPALHRLERQSWVKSEWKLTESKQRVTLYHLTASGKKQLDVDRRRWLEMLRVTGVAKQPDEVQA